MSKLLFNIIRSKVLIDIKQPCVEFEIPESKIEEKGQYHSVLTLSSFADVPLAIRVKTTKKDIYFITPNYSKVKPRGTLEITVVYLKKEGVESQIGKHKFKIEAICVPDKKLETTEEIKAYFDYLTEGQIKVQGTTLKRGVYHKKIDAEVKKPLIIPIM
jgi:hypothetical protein